MQLERFRPFTVRVDIPHTAGLIPGMFGRAFIPAGTRKAALLPAGSATINKNGATYYLNGNTWFQPAYGANGVYYTVVPAP